LAETMAWVKESQMLRKRLTWHGELSDANYQHLLSEAAFLWHAGAIDNGTFSVVESVSLGVPALSSDYPAMREIDRQFCLNLSWMDADDPKAMALELKNLEKSCLELRKLLPSAEQLAVQDLECLAGEYWKEARRCL